MEIRPIRGDEGLKLRDLRLRALADAPDEFGETLAQAQAQPDDFWNERAMRNAAGIDAITFVAVEDGRWYGMLTGFFAPDHPQTAHVVGLWVDPAARSQGLARTLMDTVTKWARSRGAAQLQHWVRETNTAVIAFHERGGYVRTGKTKPHALNPSLHDVQMARQL
ncbi:MAG: GNAT family N-acetyltransferase [Rubrobacter sp.]|nr:GNAT family N-acetyltransferase [Rubrobacter sp.]